MTEANLRGLAPTDPNLVECLKGIASFSPSKEQDGMVNILTACHNSFATLYKHHIPCILWIGQNLDLGCRKWGFKRWGLRKSEDIWGKRPFSSVFWIFQVLIGPSGKGRKRQKKGEKGRFRLISRKGGQTPLKPPFVTPPFAAAQLTWGISLIFGRENPLTLPTLKDLTP